MKGFINLYKPSGISSAKAVYLVKKKLNISNEKIGHTGTLDPMASGVLPICIGRATRLFDFMLSKEKTYIAEFAFGYETNTLDQEGEVIKDLPNIPTSSEINSILHEFIGKIEQIPPQFSAKSIDGVRAYDKARKGESIDLKPCKVFIKNIQLISQVNENTYRFEIVCGSGTYIRSIARDLAYRLNTVATMTKLERTQTGAFDVANSIQIDDVCADSLLPCEFVLNNLDAVNITEEQQQFLLQGKYVEISQPDGLYRTYCLNELVGLLETKNNLSKMKIWLK